MTHHNPDVGDKTVGVTASVRVSSNAWLPVPVPVPVPPLGLVPVDGGMGESVAEAINKAKSGSAAPVIGGGICHTNAVTVMKHNVAAR
jgi:hypothetical protein